MYHSKLRGLGLLVLAIDKAWARLSHGIWNHAWLYHAPQPHKPEASDIISSLGRWEGGGREEMPMKVDHHTRSKQKLQLRQITG